MLSQYFHLFLKVFNCAYKAGCVNIRWNKQSRLLERITDEKSLSRQKLLCYLHTFTTVTIVLQVMVSISSSHFNVTENIAHGFFALLLTSNTIFLHAARVISPSITVYFNGMLQFMSMYQCRGNREMRECISRKLNILEKINILFVYIAYYGPGLLGGITLVYGFHLMRPCQPSLAGYWLLEECTRTGNSGFQVKLHFPKVVRIPLKIFIFLWNQWAMELGLKNTVFIVSGIQILCTLTLRTFLMICFRFAAFTTVRFERVALIYRHIQLLVNLCNEVQQESFLLYLIISSIGVQSFMLTTLAGIPWTAENILPIFMFAAFNVDSILACLVVPGGMARNARIYEESKMGLWNLRRTFGNHGTNLSTTPRRLTSSKRREDDLWKRKFVKSCAITKIRFGSLNFLERLTPLKCLNFAARVSMKVQLLWGS